jgi:hypothetical protein
MGKTNSKPLAARHGRGTALARHAMCESALSDRTVCQIQAEQKTRAKNIDEFFQSNSQNARFDAALRVDGVPNPHVRTPRQTTGQTCDVKH